jgi:hypothetical protein
MRAGDNNQERWSKGASSMKDVRPKIVRAGRRVYKDVGPARPAELGLDMVPISWWIEPVDQAIHDALDPFEDAGE